MCQTTRHHFIKPIQKTLEKSPGEWNIYHFRLPLPPVAPRPIGLLEAIGEATIIELVYRHHTLLKQSLIAHLYPDDEDTFAEGVYKAAHFVIEVLGQDKIYTRLYGSPSMCKTHSPFTIDAKMREIWLTLYAQAIFEAPNFPQEHLEAFWNWIETFSLRMINHVDLAQQEPRRISLKEMQDAYYQRVC